MIYFKKDFHLWYIPGKAPLELHCDNNNYKTKMSRKHSTVICILTAREIRELQGIQSRSHI